MKVFIEIFSLFKIIKYFKNKLKYIFIKYLNINFFFLIILFLSTNIYSQVFQDWIRYYPNTSSTDTTAGGTSLVLDDSNHVYVLGLAIINNVYNYVLIKYNINGDLIWIRYYNGYNSGGRIPHSISIDKFSNVFITGYDYVNGNYFDYCTIKYSSSGVQQWVQWYDGPVHGIDQANFVNTDAVGNIYVSGFSTVSGNNSFVYTTIKYLQDGSLRWTNSYGIGSLNTNINSMKTDNNCSVYITGINNNFATTIKYDSAGNQIWVNQYPNSSNMSASAKCIVLDETNNVYISGLCHIRGSSIQSDCFTIKYSSTGIQQWVKIFNPDSLNGSSMYKGNSISLDNSGNIIISGVYNTDQFSSTKFFIIKYSNDGNLIWLQKDSNTITNQNNFMDLDNTNHIYISNSYSKTNYLYTISTTKFDSSGRKMWSINYFDSLASPSCIKVDFNNNIFLTGNIKDKLITIKYSQPLGIIQNNKNILDEYSLFQNYPNPFNTSTVIKLNVPIESNNKLVLKIYDALGNNIKNYYILKPGQISLLWDGSDYSSGLYFYSLQINGKLIYSKKMILIK